MNYRKIILDTFRGQASGSPVFVPRLDIWYNRNAASGTLPPGYTGLGYREVVEKLGVGFHSVIPDFIRESTYEDLCHRGLGFYNNNHTPYVADFSGLDYSVTRTEAAISTTYHTSLGELVTHFEYSDSLSSQGVTLPAVHDCPIKEHEDYRKCIEVFSKIKIHPRPDALAAYNSWVGEAGVPVAFISLACGPMQHILRDLRDYRNYVYDLYDIPTLMQELAEVLGEKYREMLGAYLASDVEVGLFGGNYDDTLTWKPYFDEHIKPWLQEASRLFHANGKLLLTHTDGENDMLNQSYLECGFDIADSVCPKPMTKLDLMQYRELYGSTINIWGGIPSVIMLETTCSFDEFKKYIDTLFDRCRPFDNLVFSIADTTPPDADFGRIQYIIDACRTWN